MKIVELILDAEKMANGIDAISIVEDPAIEANFVALNKINKVQFKSVDDEKHILLGPALIPNKPIYRNQLLNGVPEEFYCYFSKATIEKASQLYLMNGNQNNATLEHDMKLNGLTLVESWIKCDMVNDKSAAYGMNEPVGTWYVAMKVNNQDIWDNFVKTGKVKGFSIEGYFADKTQPTELKKDANKKVMELRKILAPWVKSKQSKN